MSDDSMKTAAFYENCRFSVKTAIFHENRTKDHQLPGMVTLCFLTSRQDMTSLPLEGRVQVYRAWRDVDKTE